MMIQLVLTLLVLTVYQQARIVGSAINEDVVPYDQGNCNISRVVYFITCICIFV